MNAVEKLLVMIPCWLEHNDELAEDLARRHKIQTVKRDGHSFWSATAAHYPK